MSISTPFGGLAPCRGDGITVISRTSALAIPGIKEFIKDASVMAGAPFEKYILITASGGESIIKQTSPTMTLIRADAGTSSRIRVETAAEVASDAYYLILEEGSSLELVTLRNRGGSINSVRQAKICKDAKLTWTDLELGGNVNKTLNVTLDGEGASAESKMLFLGAYEHELALCVRTYHKGRATVSKSLTRGFLSGRAKARCQGLVRIERDAGQSNGYESMDTLLLSGQARAEAVPDLEIDNHDVRCGHGTTIGKIDEEKIFYLMSRGLNRRQATVQIVRGYLMQKADDSDVKKIIEKAVEEALA
ncbi:MAG: SufD family Fe-S cluster assembly protein [Nanoarchaeota archaeon]